MIRPLRVGLALLTALALTSCASAPRLPNLSLPFMGEKATPAQAKLPERKPLPPGAWPQTASDIALIPTSVSAPCPTACATPCANR